LPESSQELVINALYFFKNIAELLRIKNNQLTFEHENVGNFWAG
jgi:hypothetical protein